MRPTALVSMVLAAALLAALLAGRTVVALLVVTVSALLLVDLHAALRRAGAAAILPAAAVVGVGAPLLAAFEADAVAAGAVAAGFLAAVLAMLVGRRSRATAALGATLTAGLLPGLGGSALILLWDVDPATLIALLGTLLAGEAAGAAVRRWGGGGREAVALGVLAAVATAAVVAATVLPGDVAAGIGALALLSTLGGMALRGALVRPARPHPGLILSATASVALAAPAVLFLVGDIPITS